MAQARPRVCAAARRRGEGALCVLRGWLVLAFVIALAGCRVDLYSAVTEVEANGMLAILLRNGVDADKAAVKDGLFKVRIEEEALERAILVLKNHGYPRESFSGVGEVFRQQSRISSAAESRVRLNFALTQDLAETLSRIDGVLTSRVHASLPDDALERDAEQRNSAVAFIKYDDRHDLESLVPKIKNLLSRGLAHVEYADISVVMVPTSPVSLEPLPLPKSMKAASASLLWGAPWWYFALAGLSLLLISSLMVNLSWWRRLRVKEHDA